MVEIVHTTERLKELQALPLERKIQISQARIIEWYQHWKGQVYVSFSGGKDSTVLLHLVHQLYPDVKAVFANTGLEYPEIQRFARSKDAVFLAPSMRFDEVIMKYGYPLISKEVAESIYYARRIKPTRTSERKQKELQGQREECQCGYKETERRRTQIIGELECEHKDDNKDKKEGNLIQTSHARNRRTILQGKLEQYGDDYKKAMEQWMDYEPGKRKRNEFNGKFGSGLIKSQFNKEKWLPLARELNANISHYCCSVMKKSPMKKYQRLNKVKPYIGTLATESRVRKQAWIRHGCNAFDSSSPSSQPLSFWTEQDVLAYIVMYGLDIASVYGEIVNVEENGYEYSPIDLLGNIGNNLKCTGCDRTGCIFCGFGFHLDKGETRFQRLAKTHPRQYEYCIGGGQWSDNPNYDPVAPEYDGDWKNWNPKKIWTPSEKGLGMGKVFDMVNELYGKKIYRYD